MTTPAVMQEVILGAVRRHVKARPHWDEPPELSMIRYAGGRAQLRPVPVPDADWARQDRVTDLLERLAHAISRGGADQIRAAGGPPADLAGAAFRTEAWMVAGGGDEVLAAARRRQLHAHPGRVEVRMMTAVDRAGLTYEVTQERLSGRVNAEVFRRADDRLTRGRVPGALDRIVAALLGVPIPERPEPPGEWDAGWYR